MRPSSKLRSNDYKSTAARRVERRGRCQNAEGDNNKLLLDEKAPRLVALYS